MHYRNGRKAKNGDKIVHLNSRSGEITHVGTLCDGGVGKYCDGMIEIIDHGAFGVYMRDCLHMDDVAAMLKEKGLDKRPAGK